MGNILHCPNCGEAFVPTKPLGNRAGVATKFVLEFLAQQPRGTIIKASELAPKGISARHINNAFCYLNSRGLVERVRYGHYRVVEGVPDVER